MHTRPKRKYKKFKQRMKKTATRTKHEERYFVENVCEIFFLTEQLVNYDLITVEMKPNIKVLTVCTSYLAL